MFTLIRNGGIPMLFILAFGLLALANAIRFAFKPAVPTYTLSQHLAGATLYATLVGIFAALGAVLFKAPQIAKAANVSVSAVLLEGFGEATSPAIMGFALLALVSLFSAVGSRKMGAQ